MSIGHCFVRLRRNFDGRVDVKPLEVRISGCLSMVASASPSTGYGVPHQAHWESFTGPFPLAALLSRHRVPLFHCDKQGRREETGLKETTSWMVHKAHSQSSLLSTSKFAHHFF